MQQWYQTERLAVDNLIRGQQKNSPAIQKTKQQLSLHSLLAWLFLIYWNGSAAILILCNQNCFPAFLSYKCVTTVFILNQGRVTVFLARKKLLHVTSILYIQAKLLVKINLNYLQVSKNLCQKTIFSHLTYLSLSTHVCFRPYFDVSARSSVIYCFQSLANFPLALSFSHETVAKAFLVSGSKGQVEFWQNTIWEFSIFALWVR